MNETLLMIIYILLIALLVVAIIIGIKVIMTLSKVNEIINFAGDRMSIITESAFGFLTSIVSKFWGSSKKKKRKKSIVEEEDEDDE